MSANKDGGSENNNGNGSKGSEDASGINSGSNKNNDGSANNNGNISVWHFQQQQAAAKTMVTTVQYNEDSWAARLTLHHAFNKVGVST